MLSAPKTARPATAHTRTGSGGAVLFLDDLLDEQHHEQRRQGKVDAGDVKGNQAAQRPPSMENATQYSHVRKLMAK